MTDLIQSIAAPEAVPDRVLDMHGNEFTPESLALLDAAGIPLADALRYGVRSVRHPDHVPETIKRRWVRSAGLLFEWRDRDRTVIQFRPDKPVTVRGEDGKEEEHKYIFPGGCGTFLGHLRAPLDDDDPVLFVEGTKQGLCAAVWAPPGWGVVAVPGCQNWAGTDLSWALDRKIVCLFDADVNSNRDVWEAASKLKEALEAEGADSVRFASLPGAAAKEGLDDVLGRRNADTRTAWLSRICAAAKPSLGRAPGRKKSGTAAGVFNEKGSLLAQTAAEAVLSKQPAALSLGSMVALYRNGVYVIDRGKEQLFAVTQELLGEEYRPNWRTTIEEVIVGRLALDDRRVWEKCPEPVLNCRNGLLDLRTGTLSPHSPDHLSALQIPHDWNPDATCPVYEQWAASVVPDQLDDLEESASLMLDPSRVPGKAVFLFGPSHSGKSTYLRLMEHVAGHSNRSAVSLHQLGEDRFASADLYQRILNVAADLSSKHVADLSIFKMLSGEDAIRANRKYGKDFTFTNQALFAFSANELPTVSEASRAYANRIKPFQFPYSFAGREDPSIEERMMRDELPGILVRWVAAWQRHRARGGYLPTDPRVMREFETRSDRVALWVSEKCTVHPEAAGRLVGPDQGTKKSTLHEMFKAWAKDEDSSSPMSSRKFIERLQSVNGVGDVRLRHENKNAGLNVTPGANPTPAESTPHTGDDSATASQIGAKPDTQDHDQSVVGVESVGYGPYGPYVCESSVNDHGPKGPMSQRHGLYGSLPTLPTPPTPEATPAPMSPNVTDEDDVFDFYQD